MKAGKLRHRVAVYSATQGRDPHGGVSFSYDEDNTIWAEIIPQRGKQVTLADGAAIEITHVIRTRYREDLATDLSVQLGYGDKRYEVVWIEDVGMRHKELRFYCIERS